jgi:transposase
MSLTPGCHKEQRDYRLLFGGEHATEIFAIYWKPVWNVLEGHFQIVLANAQHIKAVPGRKTDTKDCQGIAELL